MIAVRNNLIADEIFEDLRINLKMWSLCGSEASVRMVADRCGFEGVTDQFGLRCGSILVFVADRFWLWMKFEGGEDY